MTLTICYFTSRQFPCWHWFFDSLRNEMAGDAGGPIKVVVVDFHRDARPNELPANIVHVAPKPCVWQGKHRLTTQDYFAAANARNTALCLAPDGWIAYVDDLSVLLPGWLKYVRQAMEENYIVCGAYRKVLGLEVVDGKVVDFVDHPQGHDSRWNGGSDERAVPKAALFGCSLAGPVESFLAVGGWDESCDGMGYEDTSMNVCCNKSGYDSRYDRRMMTYESEELHHVGTPMKRVDKPMTTHKDASHAMIDRVQRTGRAENAYDIREVRAAVLRGAAFPIPTGPVLHWPDGQNLRTM